MRIIALVAAALLAPAAVLADESAGQTLYQQRCAMCHGAQGEGVPGIYPRLKDRVAQIASSALGKEYLSQVVLFGIAGPIDVDGLPIDGVMPGFTDLSDANVAGILNYVSESFGTVAAADAKITADVVAGARARQVNPSETRRAREQAIKVDAKPAAAASTPPAASGYLSGAHEDYVRACQGCHSEDGCTDPAVTPPLRNTVGYFVHSPEGRAYLVQVPGVARSLLDDASLAHLLNWMLRTFSSNELPRAFVPYEEREVRELRKEAILETASRRAQVLQRLQADGVATAFAGAGALGLAASGACS